MLRLLKIWCVLLMASNVAQGQDKIKKKPEMLLGEVHIEQLNQGSYKDWYQPEYEAYLVHKKLIKPIKKDCKSVTVEVFFGSWCGDSKRELPRFMRLMDVLGMPKANIRLIGLDRNGDRYKKSPGGEEVGKNIHRVPTFIFYKDGVEMNRIVESPQKTLEHDVLAIVGGENYEPNYDGVTYLETRFKEEGVEGMRLETETLLKLLAEKVAGSSELNTYGFVKYYAGKLEESLFILELNEALFPLNDRCCESLVEGYIATGKLEKARKKIYALLAEDVNHEFALEMLTHINKKEKR